ncbi:hypothetical protein [Streptomyces beihaiensis]|uniref:Uncharacterized protein n=1 Tax=Streptomyces beihaiensis TaxID=2984495 RepID=A0ABT3TUB7_9ACTN|nr:hypothetical protein [Streptomyces beihaiensis]MCX3060621.1 hypothetical protein [Streptomyces beihaiensis]
MTFRRGALGSPETALFLGPLLFGVYGVIRLLDGIDGVHGPGLAWTTGHLCFLAGLPLYVRGFGLMRDLAGRRDRWAGAALVTSVAGAFAFAVQFGVDVVCGLLANDHARMSELSDHFGSLPGAQIVFYIAGPILFSLGQVALAARLYRWRALPLWAPCVLFASVLLPFADKDLIPLAAALMLLGYSPLRRSSASRTAFTRA